jgi:peroxiredoxin
MKTFRQSVLGGLIAMVLITQSGAETLGIGKQAPDFKNLPGTDGKTYSLESFKNSPVLVISFTCNHCPYAQAYESRYIALAKEYQPKGVAFIAINSNDAEGYPEDSFEKMKERARDKQMPYPYLRDESQQVARDYGAVCTPHLFVFNQERNLAYTGRIDDNWKDINAVKSHDLKNALDDLLAGRPVKTPQTNPLGCSIKWKNP